MLERGDIISASRKIESSMFPKDANEAQMGGEYVYYGRKGCEAEYKIYYDYLGNCKYVLRLSDGKKFKVKVVFL